MRTFSRLGFLFLFFVMTVGPVSAQSFRGGIVGTVTDTAGAVIPGATVTVMNVETGLERHVVSAGNGDFAVPELPIGKYKVTVTHDGFDTFVADAVGVSIATDVTSETTTLEMRAEFFNLPNHPNFASPLLPTFIADAGAAGFVASHGRSVGAGPYALTATVDVGIGNPFLGGGAPRGIQLAAVFRF